MNRLPIVWLILALLVPAAACADVGDEAFARGVEAADQGDYEQAVSAWRRAARLGHTEAAFRLGAAHEQGQGVAADAERAVHWYREAAQRGSEHAEFNLAHMYATGQGVPEDESKAAQWYERAARRGNPHAQYALGLTWYRGGTGLARDFAEAWFWLTLAADNFSANAFRDNASQARARARERMSPAAYKQARERLQAWRKEHD